MVGGIVSVGMTGRMIGSMSVPPFVGFAIVMAVLVLFAMVAGRCMRNQIVRNQSMRRRLPCRLHKYSDDQSQSDDDAKS